MPIQDLSVAILTGRVPHYRAAFFDALASRVGELNVIAAGKRDDSFLECTGRRFRQISLRSEGWRWRGDVVRTMSTLAPGVLISEHGAGLDYVWTALLSSTLRCVPKILWTHGIISRDLYRNRRGIGYLARMQQLKLADGIICYDEMSADILSNRIRAKIIGSAPNSNDGGAVAATRARLIAEGRGHVRARLGLRKRFYLLLLGRLVPEKEVDRVVPIIRMLKDAGVDVGLVIVGHGPEEIRLKQSSKQAGLNEGSDLIFAGPIADHEKLAQWLFAADACLSPGALGLSVVDCLYGGLPVISALPGPKGPWHGPEWHYLEEGRTAVFARENSNEALSAVCASYLARPEADRLSMSEMCTVVAAQRLGIGPMVEGMLTVISAVVGQSPSRST